MYTVGGACVERSKVGDLQEQSGPAGVAQFGGRGNDLDDEVGSDKEAYRMHRLLVTRTSHVLSLEHALCIS